MSMGDILSAIHTIIVHLVGGTAGSGSDAVTITFANSWVGSFLSVITPENGLFFIPFVLGLCLFGIHVLLSLMRR